MTPGEDESRKPLDGHGGRNSVPIQHNNKPNQRPACSTPRPSSVKVIKDKTTGELAQITEAKRDVSLSLRQENQKFHFKLGSLVDPVRRNGGWAGGS